MSETGASTDAGISSEGSIGVDTRQRMYAFLAALVLVFLAVIAIAFL